MTSKDVQWDKFDEIVEASKQTVADFQRLKDIEAKEKELYEEKQKLIKEREEISNKYHQSYTNKLNDRLDKYGILTIITMNEEYEGHILSVTDDIIKVEYYSNYGSNRNEFDIPTKELRKNGYVKHEAINNWDRKCYVVDSIKDPINVFEIIKFRLRKEVADAKQELQWGKEEVERGNKRIKEATKKLNEFKKVSDNKITRTFNSISFGVTDLKIEDILKALPREVCLYKEAEDD